MPERYISDNFQNFRLITQQTLMSEKINSVIDSLDPKLVHDELVAQKEEGLEPEQIKSILERAIRSKALLMGSDSVSPADVASFLKFVIELAKNESYLKSLTVTIMQDIFDVSTTKRCEMLFSIVEQNIDVWKTPFFFDSCKNQILRMCNDLLKRLSRTVDTNFCGRILILLARSLPLNERSGLNLPGQFNLTNITTHDEEEKKDASVDPAAENGHSVDIKHEEDGDPDMEVGEIREKEPPSIDESGQIPFDYHLYVKFWGIQRFFVNPNLLFENSHFKDFQEKISEILSVFTNYKLEQTQKSNEPSTSREVSVAPANLEKVTSTTLKVEPNLVNCENLLKPPENCLSNNNFVKKNCQIKIENMEEEVENTAETMDFCAKQSSSNGIDTDSEPKHTFFAKYLTSQKLFHLQLADSQFRRYLLCQCLIVMNYLTSKARHKDALTMSLSLSQDEFCRETITKCYSILRETYPNGSHFADAIKKIMSRENLWAQWKGDNCPDFVTNLLKEKTQKYKRRDIGHYDPNVIDLGSKELTQLWRICPDNIAACKDPARHKMPEIKKFLEDTLDELDPEQEVEEQYQYQWWASRFLLFNSDQYLTCSPYDNKSQPFPQPMYLKKAIMLTSESVEEYGLKKRCQEIQKRIKEREEKAAEEKARKAAEEAERLAKERREKERENEAALEERRKQQQQKQDKEAAVDQKKAAPKGKEESSHQDHEAVGSPPAKKASVDRTASMDDEERRMKRRMEERASKFDETQRKAKRPALEDEEGSNKKSPEKTDSGTLNKTSGATDSGNKSIPSKVTPPEGSSSQAVTKRQQNPSSSSSSTTQKKTTSTDQVSTDQKASASSTSNAATTSQHKKPPISSKTPEGKEPSSTSAPKEPSQQKQPVSSSSSTGANRPKVVASSQPTKRTTADSSTSSSSADRHHGAGDDETDKKKQTAAASKSEERQHSDHRSSDKDRNTEAKQSSARAGEKEKRRGDRDPPSARSTRSTNGRSRSQTRTPPQSPQQSGAPSSRHSTTARARPPTTTEKSSGGSRKDGGVRSPGPTKDEKHHKRSSDILDAPPPKIQRRAK